MKALNPKGRAILTSFALLLTLLLTLSLPMAAFAAPTDAEGEESVNITMEYRYAEGETANIPNTITQGGISYNLISKADPVLESTLPKTRTYSYKIDGNISKKDLAEIENIPNLVLTPVNVEKEREVDKKETIKDLPNNDVEYLASQQVFNVTSGKTKTGIEAKELERAGVKYTVTEKDSRGLPSKYSAEVVYRGVETYEDLGYYTANVTYETEEVVGSTPQYIIIAQYAPEGSEETPAADTEATPPAITEEPPTPSDPEPNAELEEVDRIAEQFEAQTGNPLTDIFGGNTPLGGFGFTGAWSAVSLLIVFIALLWSAGLLLSVIAGKRAAVDRYADISQAKKSLSNLMRIVTIVLGAVTALAWYLLDDISLPMVLINNHTILIFVIFLVQIGFFILSGTVRKGEHKADKEEMQTAG